MGKPKNEKEAAEYLGLHVQTLRNWRFQKVGPAYAKLGRAIRYYPEDLDAYKKACRVQPER